MPDRNGYEKIPEVASGAAPDEELSPQDRYPEANVEEAELLGLLDEFIKDSKVSVKLPTTTVYDFPGSSSFADFLCALLLPTMYFIVAAGATVFLVGSLYLNGKYVTLFPYVVVVLGFICNAVPIQNRYSKQSARISSMVVSTKQVAIKTVEDVARSVASKVDLVKMKLCDVVLTMRPKLEKASQEEKNLKAMDPTILIPDPNNVVSELDGAKGEIEESVRMVEEIIPVTPWIPVHLQSPGAYQRRVVNKVLFLCLILHLMGGYATLYYFTSDQYKGELSPLIKTGFVKSLVNAVAKVISFKTTETDTASLSEDIMASVRQVWPLPLVLALEVYLMSIVLITVVYLRTSVSSTVTIVNRMRDTVTEKTNHVLRQQGIIFLCQDILDIRMGRVKNKLLKMISLMFKIDMLMKINDEYTTITTANGRSPSGSSSLNSPSRRNRIGKFFTNSP